MPFLEEAGYKEE